MYDEDQDPSFFAQDPADMNRLLYQNGEYYRIKESYVAGGNPYAVPPFRFDPYNPWRFKHPEPAPLHYYEDLDLKYHAIMKEKIQQFYTHYIPDNQTAIVNIPISTSVDIKPIVDITINFAASDMNYNVTLEQDKVYRIDYVKDATLITAIGRLKQAKVASGIDYSGSKTKYAVIYLDCSSDFSNDSRVIDSRSIRYVKSLSDMQTNTIITRTWVGVTEPDTAEYGGWFNTAIGKYLMYDYTNKKWVDAPDKPTEKPPAGQQWVYDQINKKWILTNVPDDIPAKPTDALSADKMYVFDETKNEWTTAFAYAIQPCPSDTLPEGKQYVYSITQNKWIIKFIHGWMPYLPTTDAGDGKIWVYDEVARTWGAISKTEVPAMPTDAVANKTYIYSVIQMKWILVDTILLTKPEVAPTPTEPATPEPTPVESNITETDGTTNIKIDVPVSGTTQTN